MVFTYRVRELRDPESWWWVASYTEFEEKKMAFILAEVYDVYRMWNLSSEVIRNILALDIVHVLGSRANADELELLLRVIERTNFAMVTDSWSRRGERRSLAPRRRGRCDH